VKRPDLVMIAAALVAGLPILILTLLGLLSGGIIR